MRHAILLLCLFATPAVALRCGNDVISTGATTYQVLKACGEPAYRDQVADAFLFGIGPVGAEERWYYNPGPNGLIRVLTFRNGDLARIDTDGRGFLPPRAASCDPMDIRQGMTVGELLQRCGEPVLRDTWNQVGGYRLPGGEWLPASVPVERWVYPFGTNRFTRYVTIIRGKVANVEIKGDRR